MPKAVYFSGSCAGDATLESEQRIEINKRTLAGPATRACTERCLIASPAYLTRRHVDCQRKPPTRLVRNMAVMASSAKWLLLLLQLSIMTSHAERAARRRPSALNGGSSCHVTQSGTGCRYALSLLPLSGGASCGQRRHSNVTSLAMPAESDVITDKLDDVVVKVTRMMKQLSVRCLRHLRQIKADLRKVRPPLIRLHVHPFMQPMVFLVVKA